MKAKAYFLLVIFFLPVLSLIAQEKQPDTKEFAPPPNKVLTINSQLDASDPMFNRRAASGLYFANCAGSTPASGLVPNYYETYTFTSNANQNFEAYVTTPGCASLNDDPYIFLYCYPFDPMNAGNNLRAGDDDAGPGFCTAFVPGDGVALVNGQKYVLVVTSFNSYETFDYELVIQSDVSLEGVPVSNWAIVLGIGLILAFAVIRFRKLF